MGAMFGAHFARAGADVTLYVVDRAHIAAISARGLHLETPKGEIRLSLPATIHAAEIGVVDLALIMVDSNATQAAASVSASILASDGFALTLQNGIGNVE